MTGFRIALKNIRLKEDPDGKVHLVRVHKMQPGKPRRVLEASAKREADKWAEHYSPIPATETDK